MGVQIDDRLKFLEAVARVRNDFIEMPGLLLTQAQAVRLWALDPNLCQQVLTALVETGFLVRTGRAAFTRAT